MTDPTYSQFETQAHTDGFDEVLERQWPPLKQVDMHTHPFAVQALVVQGEMWLTIGDATQHLQVGDTFELDSGVLHAERYGPEGATYWVARRNG